ncbi:MAG TPA: glutamyl-tRNA reductase [Pseudonocardiaceae bacterium]|nr:glutamyl-tRNA reductase [Pseudonocardiaceae bacterium]
MSLLVVGMSHRTAPIAVLERAVVPVADTDKVLGELLNREHFAEALLLTTCNRVEIYGFVEAFHGGLADATDVLAGHSGMALDQLSDYLYVHYEAAAVEHLFSVAAGLDSMVVGESQILGQLRTAYTFAQQAGTVGRTLHEVVQHGLRVGKRVRTETAIAATGGSVVSEALAGAAAVLRAATGAELTHRRALVIGAGSMAALVAVQLRRAGVSEIVFANRSLSGAQRLVMTCEVEGTPARAVDLQRIDDVLATADVVMCCTAAAGAVLSAEQIYTAQRRRRGPLVICDLGLPRNVEPMAGDLPGVTLLDLAVLAGRLEQRTPGVRAISAAQRLVRQEVDRYALAQRAADVVSTVVALRKRAAEVADAELLRLDGRLPHLDAAVRAELARTLRRVADKLVHVPTVRVKQFAERGDGQAYANALRELFQLNPQTTTAIARCATLTLPQSGENQAVARSAAV